MGKVRTKGDEQACRINYMFQAGQAVANSAPELSQYYGQVLTVITEKTAPKKDFTMKRSMCKKCHAVLKIGENATYRVRKNKDCKGSPIIVTGCKLCGERKRLPTSRGYQLKAERDGKIIQDNASFESRHTSPPLNGNIDKVNVGPEVSTSALSTADKSGDVLTCSLDDDNVDYSNSLSAEIASEPVEVSAALSDVHTGTVEERLQKSDKSD